MNAKGPLPHCNPTEKKTNDTSNVKIVKYLRHKKKRKEVGREEKKLLE